MLEPLSSRCPPADIDVHPMALRIDTYHVIYLIDHSYLNGLPIASLLFDRRSPEFELTMT